MSTGSVARAPASPISGEATQRRPVMLLTLNVPFDAEAVRFAVDAAAEAGCELMVCDAIPLSVNPAARGPRSMGDPDTKDSAAAAVRQAAAAGVHAEQFLFHSPRPESAALEIARTHQVALLVFGPDPSWMGRWRHRRSSRRIRRDAPCLVWAPG